MTDVNDKAALRRALGEFATGVTVITTRQQDGTPRGFTANSFTSVSLDPPLVLVCVSCSAASCDIFRNAPRFAINVLCEGQQEISGLFASQRADKFTVASWREGQLGLPLIDGSLTWFECASEAVHEAGDHVILVGRIAHFGHGHGRPLGFFRGRYFTLGLEDRLVDAIAGRTATVIGAICEQDGEVVLETDDDSGEVRLPAVGRAGEGASLEALAAHLAAAGIAAEFEVVYAVFDNRAGDGVSIYYRGRATGTPRPGTFLAAPEAIPWRRLRDPACKAMLERYLREAEQGVFAVYMGNETGGVTRRS